MGGVRWTVVIGVVMVVGVVEIGTVIGMGVGLVGRIGRESSYLSIYHSNLSYQFLLVPLRLHPC